MKINLLTFWCSMKGGGSSNIYVSNILSLQRIQILNIIHSKKVVISVSLNFSVAIKFINLNRECAHKSEILITKF